jgi:general secretion pathway protein K
VSAGIPAREQGAALLSVLLLVAVMGAIAASAFEKLRLSTALASNGASLDQARAYAVGIETLLTLRVDDIARDTPGFTTLEGDWNRVVRRIELPGPGDAEGAVSDGGNCFNLNSLGQGNDPTALTSRPTGIAQFTALMNIAGVPGPQARGIAESAADWVDSNHEPGPLGAEDSAYSGLDEPYRTGNTLFAEVSELRAVAGVSPEIYARLRPLLCALPATDLSPINVNTLLPDQAPLVAMLSPGGISLGSARSAIAQRPARGWKNSADFWATRALAGATVTPEARGQVLVDTRWFVIDLKVSYGGSELHETALVDARFAPSRIAVRRWGKDE